MASEDGSSEAKPTNSDGTRWKLVVMVRWVSSRLIAILFSHRIPANRGQVHRSPNSDLGPIVEAKKSNARIVAEVARLRGAPPRRPNSGDFGYQDPLRRCRTAIAPTAATIRETASPT